VEARISVLKDKIDVNIKKKEYFLDKRLKGYEWNTPELRNSIKRTNL
jgi:hypothetical protein